MNGKINQPATDRERLQAVLDDYPLYLRWSQVIELWRRLGLGGDFTARQAIAEGRVKRVLLPDQRRHHYTRSSVAALLAPGDRGEFGGRNPDSIQIVCRVLENGEATTERNELIHALHDAINSPMGVVPDSALKFYRANNKMIDVSYE